MVDKMNKEMSDKAMAGASGGNAKYGQEVVSITGFVLEDPFPNDPTYSGVWERCKTEGYQIYEIEEDGRIAAAGAELPKYSIGDQVVIHQIWGFYGWQIDGVFER